MKRTLVLLVLAVAVTAGLDVLGDLTQDRPDQVTPGSRSEVILDVRTRNHRGSPQQAAESLWATCQSTVHHRLAPPGIATVGTDRFRLVFEPAIGEHSWRRLQGCLEDMSVDNTLANVVRKRDLAG